MKGEEQLEGLQNEGELLCQSLENTSLVGSGQYLHRLPRVGGKH